MGYAPNITDGDKDLRDPASLLASRICHDLISPLGAISNGLELLAMSGMGRTPELALIEESIASANARVSFFRMALGASTGAQKVARGEVRKLISGIYGEGRIKVQWDVARDPGRTEAKLGFLAILCMESCLPAGGDILVSETQSDWKVQAFGSKIRFDPELWGLVSSGGGAADLQASQVQFALLGDALKAVARQPQIGHSDSAVSLRF